MRIRTRWDSAWEPWFAWYPVSVLVHEGDCSYESTTVTVWLETVQRRRIGATWEYRV